MLRSYRNSTLTSSYPFVFFFFFFFLFLFYFVVSPGSGNQFACSELVSVHFISMYAHDLHDITLFAVLFLFQSIVISSNLGRNFLICLVLLLMLFPGICLFSFFYFLNFFVVFYLYDVPQLMSLASCHYSCFLSHFPGKDLTRRFVTSSSRRHAFDDQETMLCSCFFCFTCSLSGLH